MRLTYWHSYNGEWEVIARYRGHTAHTRSASRHVASWTAVFEAEQAAYIHGRN